MQVYTFTSSNLEVFQVSFHTKVISNSIFLKQYFQGKSRVTWENKWIFGLVANDKDKQ